MNESEPALPRPSVPRLLFANTLEILAAAMLVAICLAVFTQVFTRYFLHIGLGWTDEASRYLQIWMVFVGATIAVKRWSHFQLNLFESRLSPVAQRVTRVIAIVVVMGMSTALLIHGIALTEVTWEQTSPMMGWRIGHIYLIVPISGLLMLAFAARHLLDALRGRPPRTHAGH